MALQCEQFKDELVTILYPDEIVSPALQDHLRTCVDCEDSLKDFRSVVNLYEKLPEVSPPAFLTDKIFAKIQAPKSFSEKFKAFFLHPASVGLTVFCLTLTGVFLYQRYVSGPQDTLVSQNKVSDLGTARPAENVSLPMAYQPAGNYRMVGWQSPVHLMEGLDRPVLWHTDVTSLEHASIEAVASFKHQLAMRHILDGEYEKAHRVLDNIADNYLNYSHWEQAVLQHMRLAKRMGREDDVQKDLSRLREYAMATPEVIQQAELEAQD